MKMLQFARHCRCSLYRFKHHSLSTASGGADRIPPPPRPPPIRVGVTESSGRGVFATRNIPAGELIHSAKPVISHPFLSKIDRVCYLCLRKTGPRKDSHCGVGLFCSEECKEESMVFFEVEKNADWSTFHNYCKTQRLKYPLLVKRLASMVISGAASADCLHILQPAHSLPEVENEYGLLRSSFESANISKEHLDFLTKQWYTSSLARIRINAFRIEYIGGSYEDLLSSAAASVESEAGVGNAVYILPSMYNHDCETEPRSTSVRWERQTWHTHFTD